MCRQLPILIVVVLLALTVVPAAVADDPAATSTPPAALVDLGIPQGQILTQQEAEEVRGERIWYVLRGSLNTNSYSGSLYSTGYSQYLQLWSNPYTVSMVSY